MLSSFKISSCSFSGLRKNSRPSNALSGLSLFLGKILTSLAIETAVSLASPVIIMTRIPARVHSSILAATSGLAGSLMPTIPTKVNPLSIVLKVVELPSSGCVATSRSSCGEKFRIVSSNWEFSLTAKARHRRGLAAISEIFSSIERRNAPVILATVPFRNLTCVHRSINKFGAPFTRRRFPALRPGTPACTSSAVDR